MDYIFEPFMQMAAVAAFCQVIVDAFDSTSSSEESEVQDASAPRAVISRRQFRRKDYSQSQMAQMLIHNWHLDPMEKDYHDFREVYRIPAGFFEEFYVSFMRFYVKEPADCTGRVAVCPKLKLLCCFFIMATGVTFLHMAKVIGCGEETIRWFFFFFLRTVCDNFGPLFIKFPETEADIRRCVETYAGENLPGCLGSIDCTHIGWVRARSSVRSWFIGISISSSHPMNDLNRFARQRRCAHGCHTGHRGPHHKNLGCQRLLSGEPHGHLHCKA
jgi:hypothetical protein